MNSTGRLNVLLFGLEFGIGNKGCEALSYSCTMLLQDIADELGVKMNYSAYVFAADLKPKVFGTEQEVSLIKIKYKDRKFWSQLKTNCKKADLLIDFTGGDSFSDIYGFKRFFLASAVKRIAIHSGTPFIMGPQTYGVFHKKITRHIAKKVISKSAVAYARDQYSVDYVKKLFHKDLIRTTDIAFLLPYQQQKIERDGKVLVGFNPSGLLWNGGYNQNNQFGLKTDYQQYCRMLFEKLCSSDKYYIYLVPHVGSKPHEGIENDANVCEYLHNLYPNQTKPLYNIATPMEIKGYISAMDVFIGARMHATVAAFSSGVATIPFSYSRKFEGLYNNLEYEYCINARELSTEEAVEKTIQYMDRMEELRKNVKDSMAIVDQYEEKFKKSLKDIIKGMIENA